MTKLPFVVAFLALCNALQPLTPITVEELTTGEKPHTCGIDLMKKAAIYATKNNKADNKANNPTRRNTLDPRFKFPSAKSALDVDVCVRGNEALFRPRSGECFQINVTNSYAAVRDWPRATIKLRVISYSDGNGKSLLTERQARQMVASINRVYNKFGVNFQLSYQSVVDARGFSEVMLNMNSHDPFQTLTNSLGIPSSAKDREYVYMLITHIAPIGFAGLCAPNPDQSAVGWGQVCFIDPDYAIGTTTAVHELGHSFGLMHPFQHVVVPSEQADPYPSPQPDALLWIHNGACSKRPQVFSFTNSRWRQSGEYYTYAKISNNFINSAHICRSPRVDPTCMTVTTPIPCTSTCESSPDLLSHVTATCPGVNSAVSACPSNSKNGCVVEYYRRGCSDDELNFDIVPTSSAPAELACGDVCRRIGDSWYTKFCSNVFPRGASYTCQRDETQGCLPQVSDYRTGDLIADTPIAPNYQELTRAFNADTCRGQSSTVGQCLNNGRIQEFVPNSLTESASLFMSYFPDHCQSKFSAGQIARIRCGVDRYLASIQAGVMNPGRVPPPVPATRACRHNGGGILVEWTPTVDLLFPNEASLDVPWNLKYVVTRRPAWNWTTSKIVVPGDVYSLLDNQFIPNQQYEYSIYATNTFGTGAKVSLPVIVDETCKSSYSCPSSSDCTLVGPDLGGYSGGNRTTLGELTGMVFGSLFGFSFASCAVVLVWKKSRRGRVRDAQGTLLSAPLSRSTV